MDQEVIEEYIGDRAHYFLALSQVDALIEELNILNELSVRKVEIVFVMSNWEVFFDKLLD